MRKYCEEFDRSSTFLDTVLSKQAVYRLMAASDIVIENLTSWDMMGRRVEAMGAERPCLCGVIRPSMAAYRGCRRWCPSARTPEEIEHVLLQAFRGQIDLELMRAKAYRWAVQHHSQPAIIGQISRILQRRNLDKNVLSPGYQRSVILYDHAHHEAAV